MSNVELFGWCLVCGAERTTVEDEDGKWSLVCSADPQHGPDAPRNESGPEEDRG